MATLVVAYDVAKDRSRRRLLRLLRGWRVEGQLSVHECWLSRAEAEELFIQLREEIDSDTDRLLLAWLDGTRDVERIGIARDSPLGDGFIRGGK